MIDRKISVAPMLDCTDRHCRYFFRQLSQHTLLYTEMITTKAIIHGDRNQLLAFDPAEHPLALQLGGSDPAELAICTKIAADYGYDEVNLNVGCPSDRVQSGKFGACLFKEPALVADCVAAMRASASFPVTVKTRIGVDDHDSYQHLCHFIETVSAAGCEVFILHARKAWLKGLSPKENREIPPLHYEIAAQVKRDFPDLSIVLNGGIRTWEQIMKHLSCFAGVMIGREAYSNPYLLAEVDQRLFAGDKIPTRKQVLQQLLPYVEKALSHGEKLSHITRHLFGLFHGQPGARAWRQHLTATSFRYGAGCEVIEDILAKIPD
ncbi:MAG: tRNA dihydrouridine(20/20a) synthase DusA [Coxiellaceae bacterium]|nr:MAG: tRNA dihydrouridine(20/20a) synthase DusA [Coxiellaceae bacterium]